MTDCHPPEPTTPCRRWTGAHTADGYGAMRNGEGRVVYVHRQVLLDIPPDMTIDHLCSVRDCYRWEHLEIVSRGENARRGNHRRWHHALTPPTPVLP